MRCLRSLFGAVVLAVIFPVSVAFAGDDQKPFVCGTPVPVPTGPVVCGTPTPPIIRDHRDPAPTVVVRDHRMPAFPPRPTGYKTPVYPRDSSNAPGGVVVTSNSGSRPVVRDHRTSSTAKRGKSGGTSVVLPIPGVPVKVGLPF